MNSVKCVQGSGIDRHVQAVLKKWLTSLPAYRVHAVRPALYSPAPVRIRPMASIPMGASHMGRVPTRTYGMGNTLLLVYNGK